MKHYSLAILTLLAMFFAIVKAKTPAPNPLSIFTTDNPGAQDCNMAYNAVLPPAPTPYPTEVGTAMTGTSTKPATTEGKVPSIPATTTNALTSSSIICAI